MFRLIVIALMISVTNIIYAGEIQTPQEAWGRTEISQGELVSSWSVNTPAPMPNELSFPIPEDHRGL